MLKDEIDKAKHSVTTDTVQITIGEVASMYKQNELNIIPDFQRLFRWTSDRKSNFVESILIGIPIPPAFVYENSDGTWELIDGLQRISTILEFMGVLKDIDTGKARKSRLQGTKYLPSLQGVVWEEDATPVRQEFERADADNEEEENQEEIEPTLTPMDMGEQAIDERGLDKSLQLFFRRHRIDFQILKYPSDPKTKFDLFQRLNRGGAYANEQEVRSCSMVLANPDFTAKLRAFCKMDDFQKIFRVTSAQRENQKDLEYAVRAAVHTFEDYVPGKDVQEFLDQAILKIMSERDSDQVIDVIGWSISTLRRVLGDKALNPPADRPRSIANRFSLRALEGIVAGLARHKRDIEVKEDMDNFIKDKVKGFWEAPEVASMAAQGLRGTIRIQRSVAFGSRWFDPNA